MLCKYGIEYVDDPASGNKIPTCHRSSFESIMDDTNFELTLEYADTDARKVYRDEAKVIEEIRKGIIEVSGKEEPYDIFICYKETDEKGNRTLDSVIAQDIYNELVAKGYRVFFSRITLEDKLGQEYEPYIFAALNSAKVMLAVGTDYEYYNAVWVKNEWSRYLKLIAAGQKKTLIPCYKNIDAYDMPKEFAKIQAQDMGKVGAMQDLLRGVEKIMGRDKVKVVVETVKSTVDTAALFQRVQMFMEDGDWINAEKYCERILDSEPTNANAYLYKLLISLRLTKAEDLAKCQKPFAQDGNYQKALRYANSTLKTQLESYLVAAENNQQADKTQRAKSNGKLKVILAALIIAAGIGAGAYYGLVMKPQKDFDAAHTMLMSGQVEEAYTKLQTMREETELQDILYQAAVQLVEQKQYDSAEQIIGKLGEYEGVKELNSDINFGRAQEAFDAKEYDRVLVLLRQDKSIEARDLRQEVNYILGDEMLSKQNFEKAYDHLTEAGSFKDAKSKRQEAAYYYALQLSSSPNPDEKLILELYLDSGDFKDSKEKLLDAKYSYCAEIIKNASNMTYMELNRSTSDYNWKLDWKVILNELCEVGYDGADNLFSEAQKWFITNAQFTESLEDYEYLGTSHSVESYKLNSNWNFSFDLINLMDSEHTINKISASIQYPDGEISWVSFDSKYALQGSQPYLWIGPGNTYSVPGTLTVSIFVDGIKVGSKSVKVTY